MKFLDKPKRIYIDVDVLIIYTDNSYYRQWST